MTVWVRSSVLAALRSRSMSAVGKFRLRRCSCIDSLGKRAGKPVLSAPVASGLGWTGERRLSLAAAFPGSPVATGPSDDPSMVRGGLGWSGLGLGRLGGRPVGVQEFTVGLHDGDRRRDLVNRLRSLGLHGRLLGLGGLDRAGP